ncbi:DNA-binding protein [Streptomyces olivoreticuli]
MSVPRRTIIAGLGAAAAVSATAPAATAFSPPRGGPPRLAPDISPIQHLKDMRRVLIDSDNLFGPRSVIPTVQQQINVIQQLRQNRGGADRRELMQIQTQFAEFCGWLHQDAGDFRAAQYWTDRALEWSHLTNDADLTVYVLARKAQLAGDMADPIQAIDVGEAAQERARSDTKLPAVAAVYAAHGYALQGDAVATHRSYDRALELLGATDLDPSSPWGVWMDPAYIEVHRARSLAALGDHRSAAAGFQTAIRELPQGYHRDRGVYLAREAAAYAGAQEPDRAADIALQALSVGTDTGSARILTELTQLDTTLTRWRSVPAVTEFHDALASTRQA